MLCRVAFPYRKAQFADLKKRNRLRWRRFRQAALPIRQSRDLRPTLQFVGAHPAPVFAQNLMVGRANQLAPVLQSQRTHARAHAVEHRRALLQPIAEFAFGRSQNRARRPHQSNVSMARLKPSAPKTGVPRRHASRASVADGIESQIVQRFLQTGLFQIIRETTREPGARLVFTVGPKLPNRIPTLFSPLNPPQSSRWDLTYLCNS